MLIPADTIPCKLLLDEQLSQRLQWRLADMFREVRHVKVCKLEHADDRDVWQFAKENEYHILTKDADYNDFNIIWGHPPKIIWLRIGNKSTIETEQIIRKNKAAITNLIEDEVAGLLEIFN